MARVNPWTIIGWVIVAVVVLSVIVGVLAFVEEAIGTDGRRPVERGALPTRLAEPD